MSGLAELLGPRGKHGARNPRWFEKARRWDL